MELTFHREAVCLGVQDNGKGFDLEVVKVGDKRSSFGLIGMEQRARLLGGAFAVRSQMGSGTLVQVTIPMA